MSYKELWAQRLRVCWWGIWTFHGYRQIWGSDQRVSKFSDQHYTIYFYSQSFNFRIYSWVGLQVDAKSRLNFLHICGKDVLSGTKRQVMNSYSGKYMCQKGLCENLIIYRWKYADKQIENVLLIILNDCRVCVNEVRSGQDQLPMPLTFHKLIIYNSYWSYIWFPVLSGMCPPTARPRQLHCWRMVLGTSSEEETYVECVQRLCTLLRKLWEEIR